MFACYFSSFVLLSSDLLPPFLARDLGFLGAWADWLFFHPDQQITSGNLMFACYFPSFVLLSSVLLPPFLAGDLGFLGPGRLGLLRGRSADIEREIDAKVLFFIIRKTFQ